MDGCEAFAERRREMVEEQTMMTFPARPINFTVVRQPQIGNILRTRTNDQTGQKVLVCEDGDFVACLSTGDRVRITSMTRRFCQTWLGGLQEAEATCSMEGSGDYLVLDNGVRIPTSELSRRMYLTVLSMVPERHNDQHVDPAEPQYDDQIVAQMLDSVPAPEPEPVLVGASGGLVRRVIVALVAVTTALLFGR